MVENILTIVKYAILFVCGFYGYLKLSKIKLHPLNLLDILVAAVFACGLYFVTKQIKLLVPLGFLLLTFLYMLARYRRSALNTAVISAISCGIAIILMVIAFVVSIPLNFVLFLLIKNEAIEITITNIAISLLQLLITFLIYRIRRFRSGLSVRNNDGSIELLLLLSILSVFLYTLFYTKDATNSSLELIILIFIFCGLGMIILWRKHVTNSYNKQIQKRNEEFYENRLNEFEKEKGELLKQNSELSKIIHRDNKLIPAMVSAVKKLIASAPDKKDLKDLLQQLEELSSDHKELISSYEEKADKLPKTDNTALDAVIHFLHSKALQAEVEMSFEVASEAIEPLLQSVKDHTDLNTVLCDLGENAIIATKVVDGGKIYASFGLDGSVPYVVFYDNGAPFDEKVIANMGRKRFTTHKAEGGSGIGLMTLFEILNKYNASYCLDEQPDREGFTKSIKITFDTLHNISIITERSNVKKVCQLRSEIKVMTK